MKKKLILIICLSIIIIFLLIYFTRPNNYKYEWVDEPESIIGQSRLYVNNEYGKHVNGKVTITYLNGKSEEIEISKDGVLYVKSIIKEVKNPRR